MTKRHMVGACLVVVAMALVSALPGCSRIDPGLATIAAARRVSSSPSRPWTISSATSAAITSPSSACVPRKGPHHYEYNAEDAMLLREADLLLRHRPDARRQVRRSDSNREPQCRISTTSNSANACPRNCCCQCAKSTSTARRKRATNMGTITNMANTIRTSGSASSKPSPWSR